MSPMILSSFFLFSSKLYMASAAFSSAVYTCTSIVHVSGVNQGTNWSFEGMILCHLQLLVQH